MKFVIHVWVPSATVKVYIVALWEIHYPGADPGFQVRGGGELKIFLWVFRVKNHDFTPKNHIFSNFKGGARRMRAPPGSTPVIISRRGTKENELN
jgi:hypothetical protein